MYFLCSLTRKLCILMFSNGRLTIESCISMVYLSCNHVFIIMIHLQTINVFSWFTYSGIKYSLG